MGSNRMQALFLLLLSVLCIQCISAEDKLSIASEGRATHQVEGSVITPGVANTVVKLYTADGLELQAFPELDGAFIFRDVPPGNHMLQPFCMGYYYPEVHLDVSARAGVVQAWIVKNQQKAMAVSLPLVLKPIGEVQHYERREPVDLWSLLKSPYGLMVAASVFFIVVMPRMKVDPDDFKEMQAQMKGGSSANGAAAPKPIAGR